VADPAAVVVLAPAAALDVGAALVGAAVLDDAAGAVVELAVVELVLELDFLSLLHPATPSATTPQRMNDSARRVMSAP
jgi:hypothetical protein